MLLINQSENFKILHLPNIVPEAEDLVFVYQDNKIGLMPGKKIPRFKDLFKNFSGPKSYCFAELNQHKCFLFEYEESFDLNFVAARFSYQSLDPKLYQVVALGCHLQHFRSNNIFCGKCAGNTQDKESERALICPQCANVIYPKIAPCVIVLVTRGEEILLARSPHFLPEVMSVLAGFVEIAESLEQAVTREIFEEVGIRVSNLKYVCSQPWPFPESLMLGFTAEYQSGEIQIDKNEIEQAGWFNIHNLPKLPNEMSIARFLIERHLQGCSQN